MSPLQYGIRIRTGQHTFLLKKKPTTKDVGKLTCILSNKLWGCQVDGSGSELCPVEGCDIRGVRVSGYKTGQLGVMYGLISREPKGLKIKI